MQAMRDRDSKRALIVRLKRVEGQLRGIQNMIAEEADCEAIAQQLAAARKAMDKSFYAMVACALEHQFAHESAVNPKTRYNVEKMGELLARFG